MKVNRILTVAAMAVSLLAQSALAQAGPGKSTAAKAAKPGASTILSLVLANDQFDVLQAAVVRAGLADVLNGTRQFTVFAPTDAAFIHSFGVENKAQALEVVNSIPVEALANILLYHVTAGRHTSTSVLAAPGYRMLNGERLTRDELTAAGIAATDISASNGVIHEINSVLMP